MLAVVLYSFLINSFLVFVGLARLLLVLSGELLSSELDSCPTLNVDSEAH